MLGLLALCCSKETTSSSNIETGGIAALIDWYANTVGTLTAHVKLVVGGADSNTYIDLEGADKLSATFAIEPPASNLSRMSDDPARRDRE